MSRLRLRCVAGGLAAVAVLLTLRAVQVALVQHDRWSQRARAQHESVIEAAGPRGDILAADGHVLATTVERVALQVDTHLLRRPDLFAQAAAPLLGADADALERRLTGGPRSVWLAMQLEPELAETVRELEPSAVFPVPDADRIYPQGELAAPLLGFTGREELRTVGRSGLEHHYQDLLAGEPDTYLVLKDGIPRRVRLERVREGRPGFDLVLTVSSRLQAAVEAALGEEVAAQGASGGSAVVMEAHTGAVLALASVPTFDPAAPPRDPARWRLRPVQDALEPGSTIKPMVAATALAAGAVRENDRFDCRDKGRRVAGHWIRDHADPGVYTLPEVLAYSANAGIIAVAERTPEPALFRGLAAFGFGEVSGVGFPAEARGILPAPERWSRMSRASLALGQELTVSPLQLAVAYAAIANGGWLLRPRLVARAVNARGEVRGDGCEVRTRVLDADLAARLRQWLELVVTEGTGEEARVAGYRTAGKTGTAQRAVDGHFDDIHHTSWFAGWFPAEAPRVVVAVAIENPSGDFWASTVAAPVFAEIVEAAASLLQLPPSAGSGRVPVRLAAAGEPRRAGGAV